MTQVRSDKYLLPQPLINSSAAETTDMELLNYALRILPVKNFERDEHTYTTVGYWNKKKLKAN